METFPRELELFSLKAALVRWQHPTPAAPTGPEWPRCSRCLPVTSALDTGCSLHKL